MDLGLSGKVAIVTGGSRGLGLAAAKALIAEGANVVVCARGEAALNSAADELQKLAAAGARVKYVAADVSTGAGTEAVIDGALDAFGRIDVLVNNVGTAKGGTWKPPATPTGRTRSTRPCSRPSACRGSRCRTCAGRAAARS